MRVLWICNIMLPAIAQKLGRDCSNKEGWLSGLSSVILKRRAENNVELHVAFPATRDADAGFHKVETKEGTLYGYGILEDITHAEKYDRMLEERIAEVIATVRPNVLHCFGTEYAHTLAALRRFPCSERTLVGIQGVCGVIALEYMANLPKKVQQGKTFRDIVKRDSILEQQRKFALRGEREREILNLAGNITGRTDFDREYAQECNPKARYFHMNETLRECFYDGKWKRENSEPHSIFLSQGDYPLKGLHYMLLAAGKLKDIYPDLQIWVAGSSLVNYDTWKDKIKISNYGKYLRSLIKKEGLKKHVRFLGRLSPEKMKEAYLKCGLYVCCSSNENSPNSLGEAMMFGVPCVAAAVGGIPSIFTGGADGILFETKESNEESIAERLADAVSSMWSDKEKMEEYCKNARGHAKRIHEREENYRRLMEIYTEIEKGRPNICFVSNYINHHQIPFCDAMCRLTGGRFTFIQTQPMEEERIRMGWKESDAPEYVHYFYREEEWCRQEILDCDVLLFGGCDEECYIEDRLKSGKTIIRISERLYKTGQWKAVTPRGLLQKYKDHTRYRKSNVYLLCAGAYVASDFHIVRAYPGKMFCWGYFPKMYRYDIDALLEGKGYSGKIPYLLWAGRFIHWKHPELALETARYLKEKGLSFHLDMIGGGDMEEMLREKLHAYRLEDCVSLLGFKGPEEVRGFMEKADIFLFTSDRQEGWGAVLNEAMNSGCAVVADSLPGSVPYLIRPEENGFVYPDTDREKLFPFVERLIKEKELRREMSKKAYETITEVWNAENAAESLMELIYSLQGGKRRNCEGFSPKPCAPAQVIEERDFPFRQ